MQTFRSLDVRLSYAFFVLVGSTVKIRYTMVETRPSPPSANPAAPYPEVRIIHPPNPAPRVAPAISAAVVIDIIVPRYVGTCSSVRLLDEVNLIPEKRFAR